MAVRSQERKGNMTKRTQLLSNPPPQTFFIAFPSLLFSPRGEAKCVRGLSGQGTGRLARGGVLEQYGEHGRQP